MNGYFSVHNVHCTYWFRSQLTLALHFSAPGGINEWLRNANTLNALEAECRLELRVSVQAQAGATWPPVQLC